MELNGKILFASDLHGRRERMRLLEERILEERPDWILLGGDLVYYGPRNGIPEDRDEEYVREALRRLSSGGRLLSCRGNCDRPEDEIPFEQPLVSEIRLNGKDAVLFHGHEDSLLALSSKRYECYLFGHTHVPLLDVREGSLFLNPGSLGFPKEGSEPGYWIIREDWSLERKSLLEGKVLQKARPFGKEAR